MTNYEISIIPNYGNDDIVLEEIKKLNIEHGKIRPSGFSGCDVPVILDIKCTEEQKNQLKELLKEKATDIVDVYQRCPHCGSII
jgi:hypothetical protein